MSEAFFACPYCGEQISMNLEELDGAQSYIEDCQVCCQPIQVSYQVRRGELANVRATRAQ